MRGVAGVPGAAIGTVRKHRARALPVIAQHPPAWIVPDANIGHVGAVTQGTPGWRREAVAGVEEQHRRVDPAGGVRVVARGDQVAVVVEIVGVRQANVNMTARPRIRTVIGGRRRAAHVGAKQELIGRVDVPIRIAVGSNRRVEFRVRLEDLETADDFPLRLDVLEEPERRVEVGRLLRRDRVGDVGKAALGSHLNAPLPPAERVQPGHSQAPLDGLIQRKHETKVRQFAQHLARHPEQVRRIAAHKPSPQLVPILVERHRPQLDVTPGLPHVVSNSSKQCL